MRYRKLAFAVLAACMFCIGSAQAADSVFTPPDLNYQQPNAAYATQSGHAANADVATYAKTAGTSGYASTSGYANTSAGNPQAIVRMYTSGGGCYSNWTYLWAVHANGQKTLVEQIPSSSAGCGLGGP